MAKKTRKVYEVTLNKWYWNEDEKIYCDGPIREDYCELSTLKEAKACIREFKLLHPKSKREKIDYDEMDLDMGILSQECLCAQTWNYVDEETNEKCQLEFDVFKVVYETE